MARQSRSAAVARRLVVCLLLALASAPLAAQYSGFGKNKVRYSDFDWQIYHSPHFDVYFYSREEAQLKKVVSFAESAYDQLSREFDFQINEPTPLIFYLTHSEFEQNNVILNFIPEGVAAFASPARNRMVLPIDSPDPDLMKLIQHELTHIFQYHILFQGSLSKAATLRPPQWFMEGMASYMANDEEAHDKMVLRDAVVNDIIPPVSSGAVSGYFAYRYGHAVFDYIEERWGKEGFRDFLYEFRNTIGSQPGRAVKRAFRTDPEDFDVEFRRWLRKKYLRQLVETGEPSDFGRPFRVEEDQGTEEVSAIASPSGDLVAAISAQHADLDLVLFDSNRRRQVRSLSRGLTTEYDYLVVQSFAVGRRMGRDLAFSPDGNFLAVFARRNQGRVLLLFDVLKGGIARTVRMDDVDQQLGLAWSPDGKTIAFSGNRHGAFDLFALDLDTEAVTQLTDDPLYDGGPAFSPDGKSLVFSSVVGEHAKLFRIDLANPGERYALTSGDGDDKDAVYSPDGRRVYFTSDRNGIDNVYGLDLETGELAQYTDVVTGCFQPVPVPRPEGRESLVYGGLWRGEYKLYITDLENPVKPPEQTELAKAPAGPAQLAAYEPAIEVNVDPANKEKYGGFKFFLTDAQTYIGVDDNQTLLGTVYLTFSDYLGDKQFVAILSSFDALSNFDLTYWDLSRRWQLGLNAFDRRDFFFVARDPITGQVLDQRDEVRITGLIAEAAYPFGLSTRFEAGIGYVFRKSSLDVPVFNPESGFFEARTVTNKDDFPWAQVALVGDSALFAPWGPVAGRRWRLDGNYAWDNGGTLTSEVSGDYRQYIPLTLRSTIALRLFAGARFGDAPTPFYLGGDNLRGVNFRSLSGDRAAFGTVELRYPLIDVLATPILRFQGIQGRFFLDIGAVWYEKPPFNAALFPNLPPEILDQLGFQIGDFNFYDSENNRLDDGISAYGFGFTVRFAGLDLNWDYAKRWDLRHSVAGFQTTFYIGTRF